MKIITENKKIQFKILKNIKIKEKWHTQQITNFYSKRQNQQENTGLNSPNNFNQIRRNINEIPELSKIQPKKTISSPKTITFLKITSPNFKSQINSMRTSPMLSPKNINKSKLLMNLQNRSIYKPKVFFNNIVIRREQNSNNSEVILNRSITEIVEKNDKTLEELLKYSNTFKKPNDFYKLLTEDEEKATKEAKILYLHKSKRKNYSNSDSLDSNQKISLKSIINSLKKNVENEELSQKKCFRRFSIDILQRKTPLKQQTAYQRSYQKQFLGNIDSKSPVKDMLKVNFQNRGTANKKKDLRIETARDKIASENFHFFVPITSRQILSKNSLLRKYSKK